MVTVEPPSDSAEGSGSAFRPTTLMERISEALEVSTRGPLSFRQLDEVVHGQAQAKREAIRILIAEGHVIVTPGPRKANLHDLVKPYLQAADPLSDRFEKGGTQ